MSSYCNCKITQLYKTVAQITCWFQKSRCLSLIGVNNVTSISNLRPKSQYLWSLFFTFKLFLWFLAKVFEIGGELTNTYVRFVEFA